MSVTWTFNASPTGFNASKTLTSYCKIYIKDGTTIKEIPGIQSIPGIGSSVNTVDTTCFQDSYKRSIKGVKDTGSGLTVKLLHDKQNFATLKAAENEGSTFDFQIIFPDGTNGADGTVATFTAYPSIGTDDASVDSALTDSLTLVVTAPSVASRAVIDFSQTIWTPTTTA